jgi:hypothetical protein
LYSSSEKEEIQKQHKKRGSENPMSSLFDISIKCILKIQNKKYFRIFCELSGRSTTDFLY